MLKKINCELLNPRINLQWAGWWEPGYVEPVRYLYDHELVVFTAGKSQVVVGEKSFSCNRGDAIIIPPGVRHWTRAIEGKVERHCFHFDWLHGLPEVNPPYVYEFVSKFIRKLSKPAPKWLGITMPFYSSAMPLKRIFPLLASLENKSDDSLGQLRRRGLFLQLLSEVMSSHRVGKKIHAGKSLRLVQILKQRIENDFRKPLSVNLLAAEFKVTPVHMIRTFRHVVGMTPLEYVHRLRLDEAFRLLSRGDGSMNIAEIAESVGFDDPNYFSRLFRKKVGYPPSSVKWIG
ncbi:MAG TPA: AraC family transcriptional regulator [Victivallales bacterium]|nr:AraC family transcriptional regulator [Victivallales bacterium]HPO90397.1 AraC family transcriptional regulator [Victivallales bacterium]HRR28065.1 AraC family transcriptional regulator [Victivallales bacterium]HRU01291.1 AraC family transcriptional regulator [Victivallales bacterium]